MKRFSFKARMIYFSIIALVSLGFFLLQLNTVTDEGAGMGSMILLILWGVLVAFGVIGLLYSVFTKNRR